MDWTTILSVAGVAIAKNLSGWVDKYLADGKFEAYEAKELATTILRMGLFSLLSYVGFAQMGYDINAIVIPVSGFILDKFLWKKLVALKDWVVGFFK